MPPQAQFVSHRITTPLFGAGLIEAIPDSAIAARSRLRLPDGVHGVPNYVINPETGQQEVGRFGWKSQLSKLHVFSGDAYLNEMGVTSAFFPVENNPQGEPIPSGADLAADPEDTDDDVNAFTSFMKFLAPPTPADDSPVTLRGKNVFESIRCTACHVPEMRTGVSSSAALSNKAVRLYSDLLLHRMGAGLADGIRQGSAAGDQFRTAPLWGLSARQFYLHDGRATSVDDAIAQHGGEATNARNRFLNLSAVDRDAVIAFLRSL